MMKKLYIDMDGVLCDFEGKCRLAFGDLEDSESLAQYRARIGGNQFWRQIRASDGEFWETMEPIEKEVPVVEIWNRLKAVCPHIAILSSPDDRDPMCIHGKEKWLDKHLGPGQLRIFESNKYIYACPQSVLVDDFDKQTIPWNERGGKSILFTGKFDEPFWEALAKLSA